MFLEQEAALLPEARVSLVPAVAAMVVGASKDGVSASACLGPSGGVLMEEGVSNLGAVALPTTIGMRQCAG